MDIPVGVDEYLKGSIEYALGLPVPEHVIRSKLAVAEEELPRLRDEVRWLENLVLEKDKKIALSVAESRANAQAVKKQISEYQRYKLETYDLKLECESLSTKCEILKNDCKLFEDDRDVLIEFGDEATERADQAHERALRAEENEKNIAADLEFYKHEYTMLKERESKAASELHKLRERIAKIERNRSSNLKTEDAPCNRCLVMQNTIDELQSQLVTSVSSMHYQAIANKVETLIIEKENLRSNLLRAEEEVIIFSEENNLFHEKYERLLSMVSDEKSVDALLESEGKYSSRHSSKGKRKSMSPPSDATEMLIDFDALDSEGKDSSRRSSKGRRKSISPPSTAAEMMIGFDLEDPFDSLPS